MHGLRWALFHGDHTISDAASLEALSGRTGISGDLRITETALTSLHGLECLLHISGGLFIAGNDALADLEGLYNLASVDGMVVIGDLPCTSAGCFIGGNASLQNLDGLGALIDLGGDLWITYNDVLPTCEAASLADRLAALGWDGESVIGNNDDAGVCE